MNNLQMDLKRNTITYAQTKHNREFSRIICAAVVNKNFQKQLLTDPRKAVKFGYCNETFHLKDEEKLLLESIHATTLSEFAAQLMQIPAPVPVAIPVSACK